MFEKGFKEYMDVYDPIKVRNYLFRNKGDLKFENVSEAWGFKDSTFSNGAAVADFDNDGDLDLVINNLDSESDLYENINNAKNNYLKLKLEGPKKMPMVLAQRFHYTMTANCSSSFSKKQSGAICPVMIQPFIWYWKKDKIDSAVIVWPDGKSNTLQNLSANQVVKVNYKEAVQGIDHSFHYSPLFTEAAEQLLSMPFVHKENKYDEYIDQVLLPHEFSRSGPFIATVM